MPLFCDVALPVPLDQTFTYAVNGVVPVVGARVLVPFSGQRLMGVVVRVHEDAPADDFEIKPVQQVLDDTAVLPDELMKLAQWIAQYYVAPLGEVLRGMLPLAAEVKRHFVYRIAEAGRRSSTRARQKGSSRRSKLTAEDQNREYAVLNYLEGGEQAKLSALRSATGANKALARGHGRKKWLLREAVAEERDARRLEKVAVLVEDDPTSEAERKPDGDSGRARSRRRPHARPRSADDAAQRRCAAVDACARCQARTRGDRRGRGSSFISAESARMARSTRTNTT